MTFDFDEKTATVTGAASAVVSPLTCFLLSDQASFITGSYHLIDGGYTAQ
ncbi:SDR family oxidoreductase [Antarctobacter heliothermus]|uniref:Uncharacterized protein n=1 Tax=Antarctobacter heliothermus TaxID=74033 RepID=A0A239K6F0_9RHOB|nr:hypothetical protein SAMN04488078_10618 [Antarctobacter heliothermus]